MDIIQDVNYQETTRQQWGTYFVIAWGIISVGVVFNLRQVVFTAVSIYTNNEAGIIATYPRNWLLTEGGEDYVFQLTDVQSTGYKTIYVVNLQPVSADTTPRTIIDELAISRSQTLAAYRILKTENFPLSRDPNAQLVTYTFVDTAINPFLEQIPTVVIALDIVTISGGQAVIITMLSESTEIEANTPGFFRFVDLLEF